MDPDLPTLDRDGAVATLTLQRPAVANRLEIEDMRRLRELLAEVDLDPQVRVLLLRGAGRHFCSGYNIQRVGPALGDGAAAFDALATAIAAARPLTVVALQGGAWGGAVDLALAADFRVGCPASEMAIPAARLGVHYYPGGLKRLVGRIGLPTARRLLLAADRLDADALRAAGLLDRFAASPADLPQVLAEFAAHLAGLAPLAVQGMKRHLNALALGQADRAAIERDVARAAASADLQEGARAWAERRPPNFEGR